MAVDLTGVINIINDTIKKGDITTMTSTSFITNAFEKCGVKVESVGNVTYTNNMYKGFIACGFDDVTFNIDLYKGKNLRKGDVLLNHCNHCAIMIDDNNLAEFYEPAKMGNYRIPMLDWNDRKYYNIRPYYNYPWNCVLRCADLSTNLQDNSIVAGTKITLDKVNLYTSSSIKSSTEIVSGTYYLYDDKVVSDRIRITKVKSCVGKKPINQNIVGWINVKDFE